MRVRVLGALLAGGLGCALLAAPAHADLVAQPAELSAPDAAFRLQAVGQYQSGVFDQSAAEIVAHHPGTQRLLVVNAAQGLVEVLDVADPAEPTKLFDLETVGVTAAGASANSVAVRADGLVAVAVEAPDKTEDGWVVFFDAAGDGTPLGTVQVGALPDMLSFTPDGTRLLVANEGEPAEDYTVDPEGTVSLIAVAEELSVPTQTDVTTADFAGLALPPELHLAGPTAPGADPVRALLEPEYITVAADSQTAWVSLQDNNALAVLDVAGGEFTDVLPLGVQDLREVPADLSDRDGPDGEGAVDIGLHPVSSMLQPDAIDSYTVADQTYVVTANEGDSRDWEGYSEVARISDLGEDGLPPLCEDAEAAGLTGDADLGRLNVSTAAGLSADGSCIVEPTAFGGRSFSIVGEDGTRVFDSADAFEQITAEAAPEFFNSNHSESNLDGRSDDKGPEPEGLTLGVVGERTYVFVGFERVGGVVVFDVTDPTDAFFVTYLNHRDLAFSVEDDPDALARAGDLGPEGLAFIAAEDSPTGEPLLAVGNEVSGTTTIFGLLLADEPEPSPSPTSPSPEPTSPSPEPTSPSPQPTAPSPAPGSPTGSPSAEPDDSPTPLPSGSTDPTSGTGVGPAPGAGGPLADTGASGGLLAVSVAGLVALLASGAVLLRRRG